MSALPIDIAASQMRPCLHNGAGSETPNPLIRRLTLRHLRVAMKEFIQRIRTLDEAEMLSPRFFYTTFPASTVGTRDGLAEVPVGNREQIENKLPKNTSESDRPTHT